MKEFDYSSHFYSKQIIDETGCSVLLEYGPNMSNVRTTGYFVQLCIIKNHPGFFNGILDELLCFFLSLPVCLAIFRIFHKLHNMFPFFFEFLLHLFFQFTDKLQKKVRFDDFIYINYTIEKRDMAEKIAGKGRSPRWEQGDDHLRHEDNVS